MPNAGVGLRELERSWVEERRSIAIGLLHLHRGSRL
jgi:hypothetical protein